MNTKLLLDWYKNNARLLPWRNTTNPYKIWLSEIILQQTRVNQGLKYYLDFIERFPDLEQLAAADEKEILKAWQGLGYYSRARNMHHTAKEIIKNYNGEFPKEYQELLKLKGVGPYTAAAIASFAFNQTVAAIDGNVLRVLSRLYGIKEEINSSVGMKVFKQKAAELIDHKNPGLFNQAMMEFGATQCTPVSPDCGHCIFRKDCVAYQTGKVNELPVKRKKKKPTDRFLHFFVIEKDNRFYIEKRTGKGIWKNLYQLPLLETEHNTDYLDKKDLEVLSNKYHLEKVKSIAKISQITHLLSHQKLHISFWKLESFPKKSFSISPEEIKKFPFPVVIANFLDNYFN